MTQDFKTPFILFDPDCPLCNRFKQALERIPFDIDLSFYPVTDDSIFEAYPFLDKELAQKEVHLVMDPYQSGVFKGAEVIEQLVKHNPQVKKLSWLLETEVGQKASEVFYRSVNSLRESLRNYCPKCKNR